MGLDGVPGCERGVDVLGQARQVQLGAAEHRERPGGGQFAPAEIDESLRSRPVSLVCINIIWMLHRLPFNPGLICLRLQPG